MVIVVKVGGAAGNEVEPLLQEIAARRDCVLVHGGSDEVDRLGQALGQPPAYYTSPSGVVSRLTDAPRMELIEMAIAGKVNKSLVARLAGLGATAVGLCGLDGGLLKARRKEAPRAVEDGKVMLLRHDLSGSLESVNGGLLELLLGAGFVPVISPPVMGPEGTPLNVDADRIAAHVAIALRAKALVLLTNVPGLLRDPKDPATLIREVPPDRADEFLALAQGRMKKKLIAAREARAGGVATVAIASGSVGRPVASALKGGGTTIC